MKYVEKAYEGEPVSLYDYQFTPKNILPLDCDGSERWLSTRIYPLKGQNDEVTHIVVTHEEDIAQHAHRIIRLIDGNISSDELNENIRTVSFYDDPINLAK